MLPAADDSDDFILTFVAGIYGMNFNTSPEYAWLNWGAIHFVWQVAAQRGWLSSSGGGWFENFSTIKDDSIVAASGRTAIRDQTGSRRE